jgi:signal peptidase I
VNAAVRGGAHRPPPLDGRVPPVQRRTRPVPPPPPGPDDDEPTVVHGDLLGAGADTREPGHGEVPGRHRRRAGASPDSKPAAEYKEQVEASGRRLKPGRRRRPTFWKELPILIVVALVLTFLIQTFLGKVYVIPSGSMETTLHGCTGCNNDRVLVDKLTYRFTEPAPGDVVVFRGPDSWSSEIEIAEPSSPVARGLQLFGSLIGLAPPDEKDFVKRVIAVGGQTVQCCDSRGQVMVDGQSLDEPYIFYLPEAGPPKQASFGPVTVPAGQLWMMGDSRNNSADSRMPDHGAVPVENVIGKARMIVLPFDRLGWVAAQNPQSTAVGMAQDAADGMPLALGLLGALPIALLQRRRRARDLLFPDLLPQRRP